MNNNNNNVFSALDDYELRHTVQHLVAADRHSDSLAFISSLSYFDCLATRRALSSDLISEFLEILEATSPTERAHSKASELVSFARSRLAILTDFPSLTVQEAANQKRFSLVAEEAQFILSRGGWSEPWIRWVNSVERAAMEIRFTGHSGWVLCCRAISDDVVLSIDDAGRVVRWKMESGIVQGEIRIAPLLVTSLAPRGGKVLCANERQVAVIDCYTGRTIAECPIEIPNVKSVAWSTDENLVALISPELIRLWNFERNEQVVTIESEGASGGAFSPSSHHLVILTNPPCVYDIKTARKIANLGEASWVVSENVHQWTVFSGHRQGVNVCAWSPDGELIATGGGHGYGAHDDDFSIRLWSAKTFEEIKILEGHRDRVTCLSWAPDSRRLASGSGSVMTPATDNSVRIWDISSRAECGNAAAHRSEVTECAWSPDGSRVISASKDGSVVVCQPASDAVQVSAESVHAAPNGQNVAVVAEGGRLSLFDAEGQHRGDLIGHSDAITACAWSPDSDKLATGSDDRTVRIWDSRSFKELHILRGHTGNESYTAGGHRVVWGSITGLAWSPDGTRVASSGSDRKIYIWNVETGKKTAELLGHQGPVGVCAWSFDGSRVVTRGASFEHITDRSVRSWNAVRGFELGLVNEDDTDYFALQVSGSYGATKGFSFGRRRKANAWSPDRGSLANAENEPSILVTDSDGKQRVKATAAGKVSKVEWLADARHFWVGSDRALALMEKDLDAPICIFPMPTSLGDFYLIAGGTRVAVVDSSGHFYILALESFKLDPVYVRAIRTWNFERREWTVEHWGRCPCCATRMVFPKHKSEIASSTCSECGSACTLHRSSLDRSPYKIEPLDPCNGEAWLRIARGLLINDPDVKSNELKDIFVHVMQLDRGDTIFRTAIKDPYATSLGEMNGALWSVAAELFSDQPEVAKKCSRTAKAMKRRRSRRVGQFGTSPTRRRRGGNP
jgi:WD40 repeat protein